MSKSIPFKADHVGSLLRTDALQEARQAFKDGQITRDELSKVELAEIRYIVDKQLEVGLQVVTDGEFRRTWWHFDFLEHLNGIEGYVSTEGRPFKGIQTERYNVRCIGKVAWNPNHPFVKDFIELKEIVGDRAVAKQTIPSPNQLFVKGVRNKEIYPNVNDYANDVIQAYRDAIQAFYDAGCRYLQFDDVYIASLSSVEQPYAEEDQTNEELVELAVRVVNEILEDKPEDLIVTTHLCRGNYRSKWAFQGGYDKIAATFLGEEKVDGFFLEYDDERSGDFKPLAHVPKGGAHVVLGVVTSKNGELEDKDHIKARIQEAAQYVPLEQLALSPQCGFSSTHHGNDITEEEQWEKLKYIVDLAEEVWS